MDDSKATVSLTGWKVPLGLVLPLVLPLFALGGAVAVARVEAAQAQVRIEKLETATTDHDRRVIRVEDDLRHIRESVDRIDKNVEALRGRR